MNLELIIFNFKYWDEIRLDYFLIENQRIEKLTKITHLKDCY